MLNLLSLKCHRAACEVKYYLKEFYFETVFAFAAVAEKAFFALAAIAEKAFFALAAVADKAIFAVVAVASKAIIAVAAVASKAIFAVVAVVEIAGKYLCAFLAYIAIFTIAAIALCDTRVFFVGCVV